LPKLGWRKTRNIEGRTPVGEQRQCPGLRSDEYRIGRGSSPNFPVSLLRFRGHWTVQRISMVTLKRFYEWEKSQKDREHCNPGNVPGPRTEQGGAECREFK